jgi:DNA-binding transcriptional regulator WhiA
MTQFTIPQIPKQKGVANHKNQTLVECVRNMLQQFKLSKKIWAKATTITTYVKNLSSIMAMDGNIF